MGCERRPTLPNIGLYGWYSDMELVYFSLLCNNIQQQFGMVKVTAKRYLSNWIKFLFVGFCHWWAYWNKFAHTNFLITQPSRPVWLTMLKSHHICTLVWIKFLNLHHFWYTDDPWSIQSKGKNNFVGKHNFVQRDIYRAAKISATWLSLTISRYFLCWGNEFWC